MDCDDADDLICFCIGVTRNRIVEAVRAGARDVMAVRRATHACGGCQSCWADIETIIAEESTSEGNS